MIDPEDDLTALARAYLGHPTHADHGRILRMAGEGEAKDHEPKLPEESWEAVNPPRPGTV